MTSISAQNVEDAANIASEFVYSLENLPGEVKFLLEEMRVMDGRVQDLQNQIDTDSARFVRSSIKTANPSNFNFNFAPSSPKPELLPAKIASSYAEIQSLSDEKIQLAEKIVELIKRTRTRLDIELGKVRVLTGETIIEPPTPAVPLIRATSVTPAIIPATTATVSLTATTTTNGKGAHNGNEVSTADKISESLRNSLMIGGTATALAGEGGRNHMKRRRITTGTSTPTTAVSPAPPSINLKIPSRAQSPSTPTPAQKKSVTNRSSRLSRSIKLVDFDSDADGEDGEGDEDADADGDADADVVEPKGVNGRAATNGTEDEDEDNHLYCFCQRPSYGNMIACDDADCPYEWFHLPCLGLKTSPMLDEWYCPHCAEKQAGVATPPIGVGRKSRKK